LFAHVSIGVSDIEKSVSFYDKIFKSLGYPRLFGDVTEEFMAYGTEESFFIVNTPLEPELGLPSANNGAHICLKAENKDAVDQFYEIAMQNGASCVGAPGLREHYASDYYAAFIRDLDGHKIEALARVS
jgi:catechol 2,3-dioxygenase-like lactoylglutathione lyase family enzyme